MDVKLYFQHKVNTAISYTTLQTQSHMIFRVTVGLKYMHNVSQLAGIRTASKAAVPQRFVHFIMLSTIKTRCFFRNGE